MVKVADEICCGNLNKQFFKPFVGIFRSDNMVGQLRIQILSAFDPIYWCTRGGWSFANKLYVMFALHKLIRVVIYA